MNHSSPNRLNLKAYRPLKQLSSVPNAQSHGTSKCKADASKIPTSSARLPFPSILLQVPNPKLPKISCQSQSSPTGFLPHLGQCPGQHRYVTSIQAENVLLYLAWTQRREMLGQVLLGSVGKGQHAEVLAWFASVSMKPVCSSRS